MTVSVVYLGFRKSHKIEIQSTLSREKKHPNVEVAAKRITMTFLANRSIYEIVNI